VKIVGLQKLTLLDYPGRVACTVFLGGCNFRCPFCHNSELLGADTPEFMGVEEFFAFLGRRRGILEGVCVTGGEPTLYPDLAEFLSRIRDLGLSVKLDTNGYRSDVLKAVCDAGLVDYVAMDIKNGPEAYAATSGMESCDLARIEESIQYLVAGSVDYEFRTTVVHPLHDENSIRSMAAWLQDLCPQKSIKRLFLQPFVDRDTVPMAGFSAPEAEILQRYREILSSAVPYIGIRGQ